MDFGKILRNKRESKGLTQEDAAKRLGVGKQLISSYETGYKSLIIPAQGRWIW